MSSLSLSYLARSFLRAQARPGCRIRGRPVSSVRLAVETLEDRSVPAANVYVTASGAGAMTGADWSNACSQAQMAQAITIADADGTVWLGSGNYSNTEISPKSGLDAARRFKIQGVDTGAGLPRFTGTWNKSAPDSGPSCFRLANGVNYVEIASIHFDHYRQAIFNASNPADGRVNQYIAIHDCKVDNCQSAIYLSTSYNVTVRNVDGTNFTKKCIDIRGGRDWEIDACDFTGDEAWAGGNNGAWTTGKAYAVGDSVASGGNVYHCYVGHTSGTFSADLGAGNWSLVGPSGSRIYGVQRDGAGIHIDSGGVSSAAQGTTRVTITDCTAHHIANPVAGYNQGDGFASETFATAITLTGCRAWTNGDAGFDFKSGPVLRDCVAFDNKRNFKFWDHTTTMENCIGHHCSANLPNDAGPADLWVGNGMTLNATNCTFHNVKAGQTGKIIEIDSNTGTSVVNLYDCLFSKDDTGGGLNGSEENGLVGRNNGILNWSGAPYGSVKWVEGAAGTDPAYVNPTPNYNGVGNNYDSQTYPGGAKGFWSGSTAPQGGAQMVGLTGGQTVSGTVSFGPDLNRHPDVRKAVYYLDGSQAGRVYLSPFYWGGASGDGTQGFDTRTLPNGTYTISGYITTNAGDLEFTPIQFTVVNSSQHPTAHMVGLTSGQTVSGVIFFGPDLDQHPDVRKAAYYLDGAQSGKVYQAPFYWGGLSGDGTRGFDTRTLPNGTYTLSGYITTSTGDLAFAEITFTINN